MACLKYLACILLLAGCQGEGLARQAAPAEDFALRHAQLAAAPNLFADLDAQDDFFQKLRAIDDLGEARRQRARFIRLREQQHARVGYKLALGSEQAQRAFGLAHPVWGALFEDMLLENGAVIQLDQGYKLAWEADLLVRFGCDEIAGVETLAPLATCLSELAAFIEIPDLLVLPASSAGARFIAVNASARYGVIGDKVAIPVEPKLRAEFIRALAGARVIARDQDGKILSEGRGRDLMGQPLRAVIALRERLHAARETLHASDWLSLGSLSGGPRPLSEGLRVLEIAYLDLPSGTLRVRARFLEP